jgi:hypothetical protein
MALWLTLACFGSNTTSPVNDSAFIAGDADTDTDTDTDTDVVVVADSGLLEVYWEGTFTETFVGSHSINAYYHKYEKDLDSSTDPAFCVYTWDTVGGAIATDCESCDFAFTVEHSAGAPNSTTNCKNTLQLGSFGEVLADWKMGYAQNHIENEQSYSNVMLEYLPASGNVPAGWYYMAPAVFDGVTVTYKNVVGYYYY